VHILEPGYFQTGLVNFEVFENQVRQRFEHLDDDKKKFYGANFLDERKY